MREALTDLAYDVLSLAAVAGFCAAALFWLIVVSK